MRFSCVQYSQIASLYHLNPNAYFEDANTFDLQRARLPSHVFFQIIRGMDQMITVYGPPHKQNSTARSRFLGPIFNTLIPHFRQLFRNIPESFIEGKISTTKGRIVHQFTAFRGIAVLFIEAWLFLGTPEERMNTIAQVISIHLIWCMVSIADTANCGGRFLPKLTPATTTTSSATYRFRYSVF